MKNILLCLITWTLFSSITAQNPNLNISNSLCENTNLIDPIHLYKGQTTLENQCDTLFILNKHQYYGAIERIKGLKAIKTVLEKKASLDSAQILVYQNSFKQIDTLFKLQNQHITNFLSTSEIQLLSAYNTLDSAKTGLKIAEAKIKEAEKQIKKSKKRMLFNKKIKPALFVAGGVLVGILVRSIKTN